MQPQQRVRVTRSTARIEHIPAEILRVNKDLETKIRVHYMLI